MTKTNATSATGLDIRDTLACYALSGLLTAPTRIGVPQLSMDELAASAYRYADAMLKARQK